MVDNATNAGATPVVAGATPTQNPPAQPAPGDSSDATPPATGDTALGDAGKQALDAMKGERNAARDAAKLARQELEAIKAANLSDTEKAIAQAKKEGADEVSQRLTGRILASEARAALLGAGANAEFVDLAIKANEFAALKVSDDGVDGLDEAVAAFKKAHPTIFAAAAPRQGSFDTGTAGSATGRTYTRDQLRNTKFFEENRADIIKAQAEGRISA